MKQFWKKTVTGWMLLAILAITNGALRRAVYLPIVGDLLAHQISTSIYIALVFVFSRFFFSNLEPLSGKDAMAIGKAWLLMTIAFEFLFGHYVFGNPWEKLLADYDLSSGRVWILALLAIYSAPYLMGVNLKKKNNL